MQNYLSLFHHPTTPDLLQCEQGSFWAELAVRFISRCSSGGILCVWLSICLFLILGFAKMFARFLAGALWIMHSQGCCATSSTGSGLDALNTQMHSYKITLMVYRPHLAMVGGFQVYSALCGIEPGQQHLICGSHSMLQSLSVWIYSYNLGYRGCRSVEPVAVCLRSLFVWDPHLQHSEFPKGVFVKSSVSSQEGQG